MGHDACYQPCWQNLCAILRLPRYEHVYIHYMFSSACTCTSGTTGMYHLPGGVGGGCEGVGDVVTLVPTLLLSNDEEGPCTLGEGLSDETSAAGKTIVIEASDTGNSLAPTPTNNEGGHDHSCSPARTMHYQFCSPDGLGSGVGHDIITLGVTTADMV